ncbi:aspartate carbamoyltransferase [Peptoniphilus sp. GNH]|nr:aspartate carbamoyltransferase [Peptoniphilus sp. GNH]
MEKIKHLISHNDLSEEQLNSILSLGVSISESPEKYSNVCIGKLLGALFFEPSTRTRLSFEAAMNRLGGRVIGFSEASSSSTSKGESLADTIRTVSCYTDIIAMRHPKEGSAQIAAQVSKVPIINAGDGGHFHPTQTLTDLLTIYKTLGHFDHLNIGFCGDLKFGRTVHSLISALSKYEGNHFKLISPEELKLPEYVKMMNFKDKKNYEEVSNLKENIKDLDILYMTRVQKERFFNEEDYVRLKDTYILNSEKIEDAKKDLIILHPLPRVNEIAVEVDKDKRAKYFEQVQNGMYVRMSLIMHMLGVENHA